MARQGTTGVIDEELRWILVLEAHAQHDRALQSEGSGQTRKLREHVQDAAANARSDVDAVERDRTEITGNSLPR